MKSILQVQKQELNCLQARKAQTDVKLKIFFEGTFFSDSFLRAERQASPAWS